MDISIIGIPLRRPAFSELTAAAVMGVGLWIAGVGLLRVAGVDLAASDAGAMLVVVLWGCMSVRLGIRVDKGRRHLLANLLVSALLLLGYQAGWVIAT